jgi:flagellar hook-associated protein 3 FlgL
LSSVIDTVQRLQELGLQGVSDSGNSNVARSAIAKEFDELNDYLISLANTRDANGDYIFAGTKANVMPFAENPAVAKPISSVVSTWETFVNQKAISDAYHYVYLNPNATLDSAIAWKDSTPEAYPKIAEIAALATGTQNQMPQEWQASVANSSSLYNDAFVNAFNLATTKDTIQQAMAQTTDAWQSTPAVNTEKAYNTYLEALNYYKNAQVTEASGANMILSSRFVYSGNDEKRNIQVGGGYTVTQGSSGLEVFGLPGKNGRTIFDAISDYSNQLKADKPTLDTLQEFDDALVNISAARASIGSRMSVLDRQKQTNEDFIVNTKTALSQIQDLDYTQAVTQLNSQQMSLQAAQQSFAKVQNLNLFKYL